jgi:hypothetical protein
MHMKIQRYAVATELLLWTDSELALKESEVNDDTLRLEAVINLSFKVNFFFFPNLISPDI